MVRWRKLTLHLTHFGKLVIASNLKDFDLDWKETPVSIANPKFMALEIAINTWHPEVQWKHTWGYLEEEGMWFCVGGGRVKPETVVMPLLQYDAKSFLTVLSSYTYTGKENKIYSTL